MKHLTKLGQLLGVATLGLTAQACAIRETTPVNSGYGYYGQSSMGASVTVGQPTPYYVSQMAPAPLSEPMYSCNGYSQVWIDGNWHWNSYEWVWVGGRCETRQNNYVYVQPYYDYSGGQYVYTPGYWSPPDRIPSGWQVRDHRGEGRPPTVVPPPRQPNYPQPQPNYPTPVQPVRPPVPYNPPTTTYQPPPTVVQPVQPSQPVRIPYNPPKTTYQPPPTTTQPVQPAQPVRIPYNPPKTTYQPPPTAAPTPVPRVVPPPHRTK
jgi:hypothetical protein